MPLFASSAGRSRPRLDTVARIFRVANKVTVRKMTMDNTVSSAPTGQPGLLSRLWSNLRWNKVSRSEALHAERELLRHAGAEDAEIRDVPCGPSHEHVMHTVTVPGRSSSGKPALVLMHGYAAGSAFYFKNLLPISERYQVHAVDWLGKGLSGRVKYTAKNTKEAEDFFLEALERWREEVGLERFVLVGHSFGGYLSAKYALRHPERVEHVVLVGPAGVPSKPQDWTPERFRERMGIKPYSIRSMMAWLFPRLWDAGFTHGDVVRFLGPIGRNLTEGYTSRRFVEGHGFTDEQKMAFAHYMYQITAAKGSGEYALRHVLEPFAWAREPIGPIVKDIKVPVSFIYGESDWMRPQAGIDACELAKSQRSALSATDLTVKVVPKAGHFVFLDQPDEFHKALFALLQPGTPAPKWRGLPWVKGTDRGEERGGEMEMGPDGAQPTVA